MSKLVLSKAPSWSQGVLDQETSSLNSTKQWFAEGGTPGTGEGHLTRSLKGEQAAVALIPEKLMSALNPNRS